MGKALGRAIAAVAFLFAMPVTAQSYSDGYTFLKAVKDRDVEKLNGVISQPGSVVINSKERGSGDGAVHIVSRGRDLAWLNYLLQKGARADLQNAEGNTALAIAAQLGWVDGAQLLLARRASVDLANSRGETPLILAVQRRDIQMVRLLLAGGANPKKTDSVTGYSALDYAKQDARAAPVLKLLEAPIEKPKAVAGPKF
ncbi:ankyrin repeat domain-containing protein [Sphingosinicella sp. BN140058]|uniref:ankyrin repeat domain-containing protein n=1 Tax=Sphingosinicella sp. BN140058 TaxID=1892855 RepID=UPI001FB13D31|nr:ankyrin repeat domain-containing protein [Sphingosinicella sp. BN140058]